MHTFKIHTTVDNNGTIIIKGLPLKAGQDIEVIINQNDSKNKKKYPLKGKPFSLKKPFDSVTEKNWEVLK
jgi:bifunctional DNA-binding transcriptional regulator/antitoxin component of YhaV-PrlF toxin-antitoxin module